MTDLRISKDKFKKCVTRLEAAFMKTMPEASIKIYFEKLRGSNEDQFTNAVEYIIDNDNFFPSIARLREIALPEIAKEYTGNIEELYG